MIREFRLSPSGSGRGVSCDASGAFVGAIPLLKRSNRYGRDRWEPRDCSEQSKQIGGQFGLPVDMFSKAGGLRAISNALNEGDVARAQIATVLLGIPDPPPLAKAARSRDTMIRLIRDLHWSGMIKADWDADEHPRWPAGAPDSQGGQFAPKGDEDECGRYARHRRKWEIREGKDWPRDAQGRRYDVHHKKPIGDGGTDDLDNIEPMQHDDHVREHSEKGDYRRWGKRGAMGRKSKKQGMQPTPSHETKDDAEVKSPNDIPVAATEPKQDATVPAMKPNKNPRSITEAEPVAQVAASSSVASGAPDKRKDNEETTAEDEMLLEALIDDALVSEFL